jgi:radical SAM superfamily enzyme YgiQ (UPF0313 family)
MYYGVAMKIYLIELRNYHMGLASSKFINSLMLPILAAWSERRGWHATARFTSFEKVDYKVDCDVVALCLYTFLAPQGYEVARRFAAMGKVVVIGGPHTKGCAEEVREHADLVFDRCEESVWAQTLAAIERGDIQPGARPGRFVPSREIDRIPPWREIEPHYGKGKIPMLLSSLGCPHDCEFCTDWNSTYRKRDVDEVIEDVRALKSDLFIFCDPNFGAKRTHTAQLLEKLVPLKKKYLMETSLVWLLNDEYLELLKASGCVGIQIGLESLTTAYKKNGRKHTDESLDEVIAKIARIKAHIPIIQVDIIFGLDEDSEETFATAVKLYKRSNIDILAPFVVTPLPGTPFYDRKKAEGRIFETDWRKFNCSELTITLPQFTVSQFYEHYIRLQKRLFSPLWIPRKVWAHWWQYHEFKTALLLSAFLLNRSRNAMLYDVPRLRESQRNAERKRRSFVPTLALVVSKNTNGAESSIPRGVHQIRRD